MNNIRNLKVCKHMLTPLSEYHHYLHQAKVEIILTWQGNLTTKTIDS